MKLFNKNLFIFYDNPPLTLNFMFVLFYIAENIHEIQHLIYFFVPFSFTNNKFIFSQL